MSNIWKRLMWMMIWMTSLTAINAQSFKNIQYPTDDYFIWPVKAKVGIVANFGELRPNHYHMGLDCMTDQKENAPIIAAADGYIAKINIDPNGFGRAIYINHPNGLTTVYAHLNDFFPELEKYVQSVHYQRKTWRIQFDVPTGKFPIKQGQFIGYSGNTGGSLGPHLHFEIRETHSDQVLNPLLFDLGLKDLVPPDIMQLAIYDRGKSTHEQSPSKYILKKKGDHYEPVDPNIMMDAERVSFAITAHDRLSGSMNPNGIYRAEYWANDQWMSGFELNRISYDETRYLNGHIDFKVKANKGPYLQHLSPLPGYLDSVYQTKPGTYGILDLSSSTPVKVRIRVSDTYGNQSEIHFTIQQKTITLTSKNEHGQHPLFAPGHVNIFENKNILIVLPDSALYDTIHFNYSQSIMGERTIHNIHHTNIPVQTYYPISIQPIEKTYDSSKYVMKLTTLENKIRHRYAQWKNGWFKSSFREFGQVELIYDTLPPQITPLDGFHSGMNVSALRRLAFNVTDNTREVASFTALLDGAWLMFSNDKEKSFIYKWDERVAPGEHSLELIVSDLVGNITRKTYHFTR